MPVTVSLDDLPDDVRKRVEAEAEQRVKEQILDLFWKHAASVMPEKEISADIRAALATLSIAEIVDVRMHLRPGVSVLEAAAAAGHDLSRETSKNSSQETETQAPSDTVDSSDEEIDQEYQHAASVYELWKLVSYQFRSEATPELRHALSLLPFESYYRLNRLLQKIPSPRTIDEAVEKAGYKLVREPLPTPPEDRFPEWIERSVRSGLLFHLRGWTAENKPDEFAMPGFEKALDKLDDIDLRRIAAKLDVVIAQPDIEPSFLHAAMWAGATLDFADGDVPQPSTSSLIPLCRVIKTSYAQRAPFDVVRIEEIMQASCMFEAAELSNDLHEHTVLYHAYGKVVDKPIRIHAVFTRLGHIEELFYDRNLGR